jgi:hypothetical protein
LKTASGPDIDWKKDALGPRDQDVVCHLGQRRGPVVDDRHRRRSLLTRDRQRFTGVADHPPGGRADDDVAGTDGCQPRRQRDAAAIFRVERQAHEAAEVGNDLRHAAVAGKADDEDGTSCEDARGDGAQNLPVERAAGC